MLVMSEHLQLTSQAISRCPGGAPANGNRVLAYVRTSWRASLAPSSSLENRKRLRCILKCLDSFRAVQPVAPGTGCSRPARPWRATAGAWSFQKCFWERPQLATCRHRVSVLHAPQPEPLRLPWASEGRTGTLPHGHSALGRAA